MSKNTGLPRTVQGALQNARAALGKQAEQDVHFEVFNTGAGYDWRKLSRGVPAIDPVVKKWHGDNPDSARAYRKMAATALAAQTGGPSSVRKALDAMTTNKPKAAKPRKPRTVLPAVVRGSELPDAPKAEVGIPAAAKKAAKRPVAAKKRKPLPKATKPKKASPRSSNRTPRAS